MTTWPAAPAELPALDRTVHVWSVRLDDASVDLDSGRELLSPDERERAARFHFEQHRRRYLIAHIALHEILGRYLQIDPATLFFDLGSNGKPKLPTALAASGVEFNLSHSNEMALLAVNCIGELGVDIEYVKPDFKFQEIAERFFTAKEVAAMRGLPPDLQRQAFFQMLDQQGGLSQSQRHRAVGQAGRGGDNSYGCRASTDRRGCAGLVFSWIGSNYNL